MDYIFSFSSRNSAMRFADALSASGGKYKLVNSPIQNGSGCGLAVKCNDYNLCSNILNYGHYMGLRAVYSFDGREYKSMYNAGN
ncbi:MAG: DUF3343 domain-containing protein [Clostridiales bacterium]|nr:DUF3343 domain-containing protein [Clostridiales bacterium]